MIKMQLVRHKYALLIASPAYLRRVLESHARHGKLLMMRHKYANTQGAAAYLRQVLDSHTCARF